VLESWQASWFPPFEGLRIVGHRWSAEAFQLKDLLARNLVPYQWLDIERASEARELLAQAQASDATLPVVVLADGTVLVRPTPAEIAVRIGLDTTPDLPFYDLIIIGGGPAGLAAAVYGASEGLRTLVVERQAPGGQAGTSARIENYLGFPAGLSGADLARRAIAQAKRLGAEFLAGEAVGVKIDGPYRSVQLAGGGEVNGHSLLIAAGVSYRRLDVPGVERLHGAGVYYGGALSEALATKGERVFIVGGGNSAGQAAVHFAAYAECVTLLVRGDSLAKSGMSQYLIDRMSQTPNIQVWFGASVVEAMGNGHLEALCIQDARSGTIRPVAADNLFIFIGATPVTSWLDGLVAKDPGGYVLTGPDLDKARDRAGRWPLKRGPFLLETSVPGIFVAGDVRHRSVKRIASATGEGAMAVSFVHQYLSML
jgi:thioredoxin reductase (NADPH)